MASRDTVARELEHIRAHHRTLVASDAVLDDYVGELGGFTDAEVVAGVRLLLSEYRQLAAPKMPDVKDAVARAARRRRDEAVLARAQASEDAYCPHCGTRELVEVPHPGWDTRGWRGWLVAAWRKWLGDLWGGPEVAPILTLPPRLEARCRPDCIRVTGGRRHAR